MRRHPEESSAAPADERGRLDGGQYHPLVSQIEPLAVLETVAAEVAARVRAALAKRVARDTIFGDRLREVVASELGWTGSLDAANLNRLGRLAALEVVTGRVAADCGAGFGARTGELLADFVTAERADLIPGPESLDWTSSPHDALGPLWEAAQPRASRRQNGQFYSAIDPVDLIVAWCVRSPSDLVLDPACGTGAFLIRAWSRLRSLGAASQHDQSPASLIGVDVDPFSLRLAARNLAARLARCGLRRADFFALDPSDLPGLRVVLGNPPYTRQELLAKSKASATAAMKRDWGDSLDTGRSGLYVPFLMHALVFLPRGGRLGMLVSNSWLNASYGVALRRLLLSQCAIEAVIAPSGERWFAAGVNPVMLVARREPDQQRRREQEVRFVRLKRPLGQLIGCPAADAGRWAALDRLKKLIEAPDACADGALRVVTVRQRELSDAGWAETAAGGALVPKHKWWIYLGGCTDVMAEFRGRCRPLVAFATVRRGITTGANAFFYVRVEGPANDAEERGDANVARRGAQACALTGREAMAIVTRDGSRHEIEARYLRPVLTSSREIAGLTVDGRTRLRVVLLPEDSAALKGTKAAEYVLWGEEQGYGRRTTCRARKAWWHLDPALPGEVLWCKTHYARHLAPLNAGALADCNLYYISPLREYDPLLLAAALNSAVVALFKELHGRANLGEGALKTEVCDVVEMPVPDLDLLAASLDRKAIAPLLVRPVGPWKEEMAKPDRQRFDEAIIGALGLPDPVGLCRRLYAAVEETLAERLSANS